MSSFLPNVIVTEAMQDLKLKTKIDPASLQKKVRAGLDRLYDYQHEDGGWGWWKTDDSHPLMTSKFVAGLAQARNAGYDVQPNAIERGGTWLRGLLDGKVATKNKLAGDVRAYAVFALVTSGAKDKALLDAAWSQRSSMTPYGLALTGLAMQAAGDARASEAAGTLESQAVSDDRETSWPVHRDEMLDFSGDATPEATAHVLRLLTATRPASPLLPKAALWLVNHRDQGYYWESTKQTALVVYGLTGYLKASGELSPSFDVTLSVNGKEISTSHFKEASGLAPDAPVIRLKAADLAAGTNSVRIVKKGAGRLYWSARAEYYSTEEKLAASGSESLTLARDYFKLTPVKEGTRIAYQLDPLDGPVQVGDVLVARLTIGGGSWRYLLIEDPIPAGVEFVENDENYQFTNRPPWWKYVYARREFHDDHAALFQTWFLGKEAQHALHDEGRQSRQIPHQPGACPTDVSTAISLEQRQPDAGGEVNAQERRALTAVWSNKGFWVAQTFVVALWLALAMGWFWLPDSKTWGVAMSAVGAIPVVAGAALLLGSAFLFYGRVHSGGDARFAASYREALSRWPSLLICEIALSAALWLALRPAAPRWIWLLVPLLLAPVVARIAAEGLSGISHAVWKPRYFAQFAVLTVIGVVLPYGLAIWRPALPGLALQTASLALRFVLGFELAVIAWLMLASLLAADLARASQTQ